MNLVFGVITAPQEGEYGYQEGHAGSASGGARSASRLSKDGLFEELKKALAERVLNAELDDHLEGEAAEGRTNRRNGYSKKTVLTETAKIDVRIPRDREGTFDPKLIQRYQRRFPGFDDKIVSMYARGMSVREIQGHLAELYGIDVSPDLISTVNRCCSGNGLRMAEPAARGELSAGLL